MLPVADGESLRCSKSVKIERDYVNGGSKVVSNPCYLSNIDGKCQEFEEQ
jgi:hypothetical protein